MISSVRVDVVIPCFNGARFIERCIMSVLTQTVPVSNIIFVNDGSTDESLKIILKLSETHSNIQVLTQANQGSATARNRGITFSDAAFICFLDVDDYWLPNKIENQLKVFAFNAQRETIAVVSNYFEEKDSVRKLGISIKNFRNITPASLLTFRTVIPGSVSSALVPRLILDRVGYFDEDLKHGEDLDLWIRISREFNWHISNERDVVVSSNPNGVQAQRLMVGSSFERDALKILNRYRSELSSIKYFVMNSFIRSISIRGRRNLSSPLLLSFCHLIIGACYSLTIKIDRISF